jgi:hypothetical protein
MKVCSACQRRYEDAALNFCGADGQPLVTSAEMAAAAPVPQPLNQNAGPADTPFSASLALMLFANFFLPPASGFHYTNLDLTSVPTQPDVKVSCWGFADDLIVISFWFLLRNNLIRLTPGAPQQEGLIFRSSYIPIIVEANHANPMKLPGLEFDLLEITRRSPPGVTVGTLAAAVLGNETSFFPGEKVYTRITQWAVQLGYGQQKDMKRPLFSLGKIKLNYEINRNFDFEPDHQRIAQIQPLAQTIHRDWMKCKSEQPEMVGIISKEVQRTRARLTIDTDD